MLRSIGTVSSSFFRRGNRQYSTRFSSFEKYGSIIFMNHNRGKNESVEDYTKKCINEVKQQIKSSNDMYTFLVVPTFFLTGNKKRNMQIAECLFFPVVRQALVPLQKDAVSAIVLNVRKYCEFAHAHLQPGHVDTEKASNALLQAVYFSDELQAQFSKINGFVREHGKVLSTAYSQYAHFLYSAQSIEEALPKIEQLLKTALSLNPKNEQAHEVQLTMKFNWQKQNPSPGLRKGK